jgi:endonuclease/exonuclease/phosphatase family metal-dependent hydrolase
VIPFLIAQVVFMTYNIRYDADTDQPHWSERRETVAWMMRAHAPDFVGIQEGLHHQLVYLDSMLAGYARIGVGRDDGAQAGEYSAIYYRSDRWALEPDTDRTEWFSETPDRPSKVLDAAFPRVMTHGRFVSRDGELRIRVVNTHFDHVGQAAREFAAGRILHRVSTDWTDEKVVLMGDFNVTPEHPVYATLAAVMRDAKPVSETPHQGPAFTFEGFEAKNRDDALRIDYIFVPDGVRVIRHAHDATRIGRWYPSDHLPVVAELVFD